MAEVKFIKTSNIANVPIVDGQYILDKTTGVVYNDVGIERITTMDTTDDTARQQIVDETNRAIAVENLKVDKTQIVQTLGTSTENVMSQKTITDELNKKVIKPTLKIDSVINPNTNRRMLEFYIADFISGKYKDYNFMFLDCGYLPNIDANHNSIIIPLSWLKEASTGWAWQGLLNVGNQTTYCDITVYRDSTYLVLQMPGTVSEIDIRNVIIF